jgi:hypothetical protein
MDTLPQPDASALASASRMIEQLFGVFIIVI